MQRVLGPDATFDPRMTAHLRWRQEEGAARVLLLEQQEAALILRHQHEQENLRLEHELERLRLKQEREKVALAASLELDQETAALAASLKRKRVSRVRKFLVETVVHVLSLGRRAKERN
jgi:hypothetical protein